jgi:uncharacterized membrane protein YfbV (UPF0208 family)
MTDFAKGFVSGVAAVTLVWLMLSTAYQLGQKAVCRQAVAAGVMVEVDGGFNFKKGGE